MVFFGLESGSDAVLKRTKKQLNPAQILSFAFIRRVKEIHPDAEIIVQTYVPTPQLNGTYGDYPLELKWAQKAFRLRQPRFESL
jgi:hypothetical protein